MANTHTFHIPVMGLGYTVDSPLRIAHLGIDSAISLVDDILMEKLRKVYSKRYDLPYEEISPAVKDCRAKRITSYLNMINELVNKKFDDLKNITAEKSGMIKDYFSLLPESSTLKQEFKKLTADRFNLNEIKGWLKDNLYKGSVDVNIMTKLDTERYENGELLPSEYNDAHAALRGFASSDLSSSLVLSAGMNPRLYGYMEQFKDFYPDAEGQLKKKIILKVSDYKSALIQGRFLAKKGLWISEYRIESGLNCGGHAFATEGYLMGPILEEFKLHREELIQTVFETLVPALEEKGYKAPAKPADIKITAQGGIGTAEEHQFLMDHYGLDAIGWGTPFLLVPEATMVDELTLQQLIDAREEDLSLSNVSPLGVKFNNLNTSTMGQVAKQQSDDGSPGYHCTKRFLVSTKQYSEKAMCTASKQYIKIKMDEMKEAGISEAEFQTEYNKLIQKECLCKGLTTSAYLANGIDPKTDGPGVSICPGPNLAYFDKKMSLKEMVDHIYGRTNVIRRTDRPHVFIKELTIYMDYLKEKFDEARDNMNKKQEKYLKSFVSNMKNGISYYQALFSNLKGTFESVKPAALKDLQKELDALNKLSLIIDEK